MNDRVRATSAHDAFTDRVMAAIALVGSPSPTRSFVEAVRSRSGHDAMSALVVAWHLAMSGERAGPRVRARSLALVIAVASVLASGSMMAASAARVIVPNIDRSRILAPSRSVIIDARPDPVVRTATTARRPVRETVLAPAVVVISKKTDPSVRQTGGDGHGPAGTPPPAHGPTPSHPPASHGGHPGSDSDKSDESDTSDESDQGHGASDDAGHEAGDDGTSAGDAADDDGGDGGNHQGHDGSGDDDAHSEGQGETSGD